MNISGTEFSFKHNMKAKADIFSIQEISTELIVLGKDCTLKACLGLHMGYIQVFNVETLQFIWTHQISKMSIVFEMKPTHRKQVNEYMLVTSRGLIFGSFAKISGKFLENREEDYKFRGIENQSSTCMTNAFEYEQDKIFCSFVFNKHYIQIVSRSQKQVIQSIQRPESNTFRLKAIDCNFG